MRRKMWRRSILDREEDLITQSLRKPITLNEYMPRKLRRMENIFVICYQAYEEKTSTEETMEESYNDYLNLPHDVCTIKISFNDENLLLGSKLHNRPILIKWYIIENMFNCILMDDSSTINILPLKIMKELGIFMDKLFPSHLMIQGFNQRGQNTMKR